MDILLGITIRDWLLLLKQNGFNIMPKLWAKTLFFTVLTLRNSYYKNKESNHFDTSLKNVKIEKEPIFILGHWRSGTTFLHNLLCLDSQFAFPNLFQIYNPHSFLYLEFKIENRLQDKPEQKRPMDNIQVDYKSPGEDEFALAILSLKSPMLGWVFPKNEKYYDRYLSFRDVGKKELDDWILYFQQFLKKLTFKYNKQLLLKSPTHTARIKVLLEIFPNAKFIHIARNPYHVFQSTLQLYTKTVAPFSVQKNNDNDLIKSILSRYQLLYNCYFAERELIPKQNLIEVKYEDIINNKLAAIKNIYDSLGISEFESFKTVLQKRLKDQSNYKKNKYPELEENVKKQVYSFCRRSFEEWSYEE